MKKIFLSTVLAIIVIAVHAKVPANVSMSQKSAPLSFMENKGQVMDQNRQARPDIQFSIKAAPGLNIFIGKGAIHYQFSKAEGTGGDKGSSSGQKSLLPLRPLRGGTLPHPGAEEKTATYTMYRMDVELIGGNTNAEVFTEQKQDYYENYFNERTGEKGATAYTYNRITYKNIYPNIDWVLYMNAGQLEHEFVIHKDGNASDIQLKYGGATGLKINTDGSLTATTPQGTITEQAPKSYQPDGTLVKSGFKLSGDVLTYETSGFKGELVIDPTLQWATYYSGNIEANGYGVATDGLENVYLVGFTTSLSDIATSGAYQTTFGGNEDTYLSKFSSSGTLLWATYYGGSGADEGNGVAIDRLGNVFISGGTNSNSGIATGGSYQATFQGFQDAFLAKFNSSGSLQWGTYYGGSGGTAFTGSSLGQVVATDSSGNVYITGGTSSTTGISTSGAYQRFYGGGNSNGGDAFLAKFNNAGAIQWATYLGGGSEDQGYCVATDTFGNVFISGSSSSSSAIATSGAYQTVFGGVSDAFLAKFNGNGAIQWSTYYGGNGTDDGFGVAIDGSENVYLTGSAGSGSGIATPGAYQTIYNGRLDGFLAKFNGTGLRQWATYFGGDSTTNAYGIALDNSGAIYITGETRSIARISTAGAPQPIYGGDEDAFLAQFNITGTFQWGTYFGGTNSDGAYSVTTDALNNIYVAGGTQSTSGIATSGAYQTTYEANNGAGFLSKFNNCVNPSVSPITGPTTLCALGTITLTDTTTGGTWGSSNTNLATVSSGEVSGVAAGLDTITYSVTNGCGTTTVSCPVTVNAAPTVNTVTNQTVCAGDTTTAIHFTGTGTGTVYNWTCNNTSIGLAASGTGNIGSFTAVNTGNTPVVAQVTVTPVAPQGYAYIACLGSNSVFVVNTTTHLVVDTVNVGEQPVGVSVSPDGSKVYVSNADSNSVSVINTGSNTVSATIKLPSSPMGIVVSPDGSKVFVASRAADTVSVISTATNAVIATINVANSPWGLAVSPDGSKVYVSKNNSDTVAVINTVTNLVVAGINIGSSPYGLAVIPDGSKLYVTNYLSGTVTVINTATNTLAATISTGNYPLGVSISPDGKKAYVVNQGSNTVSVISTITNTIIATINVGTYPYGVSVTPDGSEVYVTDDAHDSVSVISTATNTVTNTIIVGNALSTIGNFITSGNGCTGTPKTFTITVNPTPTATYTTSTGRTSFCQGDSLTLTAGTESGYLWSTGATTQSITVNQGGNEGVTVTDNHGCTASISKNIAAFSVPTSSIVQRDTSFCQGDSVTLTSASQFQYLWSTGATTQNITVKQGGSYVVVATNPVGCADSSAPVRVTVNTPPAAAINGPTSVCATLSATLTASGGTGYSWSNGLGINASVTVSPVNNTTYTVTVSNAHNCTATAQQTVSVTNTPTASISGATEDCSGNGITLTANGGNTYNWSGGLGSNAAITVSPTSTTTYMVTATIGVNCSASASQTVTVNQPASSQFSQSICAGDSYSFNNQNLNQSGAYNDTLQTIHGCDSIVTLNLTVNNAVQTAINDTTCKGTAYLFNGHTLNQAGIYKDTLNAANTCDSIVTLSLVIDSVATPTITRTGNVLQTQTFASYQWLLNGTAASGTAQSFTIVQDGNYSVVVTGTN